MSKVCLLNDTSEWYHWGCYGSSMGLQGLIERVLHPTGFAIVPIDLTYAASYLPDTPAAFRDPHAAIEFLKTWPAAPALLEASDIVINGEGTIHSKSAASIRLLYIAYICSTFLGKRVRLVNHSVFPPLDNADALEFYKLAYAGVHGVAVRESDSARIARDVLGREARLAFDCLPLTLAHAELGAQQAGADYAIITGTSGITQANVDVLKAGAAILAGQGLRLVWLLGAPRSPAVDERLQAEVYARALGAEMVTATSFEEWARLMRDARFVLSGRFHYVIARLCLGGPFVTFGGNTPKITALLRDQGLPELVIDDADKVAATMALAARTPMPARVAALAEAAALNMAI